MLVKDLSRLGSFPWRRPHHHGDRSLFGCGSPRQVSRAALSDFAMDFGDDEAAMSASPVGPPSRSVRTKILWVVTPLVAVLAALLAFTTSEVGRIHRDLARVSEEDRETEIARSLLTELRGAEAWANRAPEATAEARPRAAIERDLAEHLDRALELVDMFLPGDEHGDPSRPVHETRERDLHASLRASINAARPLATRPESWAEMSQSVADARRAVEVLVAEANTEELEAATHLDERVHRLVDMLTLVAVAGFLTLLALSWTFRRVVLRPLRQLRRATHALGRGEASVELPVASDDEFGQLAATFNDVAARLDAYHEEMEQRVTDRTHEVFRTARLADLGTLAAGIAHEINNPLGSIAAGVEGLRRELIASGQTPSATLEFIDLVLQEARRASEISGRLLRLGRRDEARREPVWLAEEAAEVVKMVAHLARRRCIEITVDFTAGVPPIEGDPVEWRQVLLNLVRNAVDASPDQGRVRIQGRHVDRRVVIRVRDEGAGFADDLLDRVFEPFFTTKAPGEGTGLGLAIVHRIVAEGGGSVRAGNWERGGEVVIEVPCGESGRVPTNAAE